MDWGVLLREWTEDGLDQSWDTYLESEYHHFRMGLIPIYGRKGRIRKAFLYFEKCFLLLQNAEDLTSYYGHAQFSNFYVTVKLFCRASVSCIRTMEILYGANSLSGSSRQVRTLLLDPSRFC